jgi:glycosyltransferase involved in cell wall biosynthesis
LEIKVIIGLIASPFVEVPPKRYGGTELFIANLAVGLTNLGHQVIVYANGESNLPVEVRFLYPQSLWPLTGDFSENLRDINHTAWATSDAVEICDIVHVNNLQGLPPSRFTSTPFVYTIHHDHDQSLSDFYSYYPNIHYVTISKFQQRLEEMPSVRTIHHGIDLSLYQFRPKKQQYLSFLGRIAPFKGTHLAIQVAKKCGIPLKIAGEVQPLFQDYFDAEVKPHIDGKFIEFIGEADLQAKNELLGNSMALLFPIEWNEPFGLVMIEAMACGTPVLALPGGSVAELVRNGVNGYVCRSLDEMAKHAADIQTSIRPRAVREYAELHFSTERMATEYLHLYNQIYDTESPRMFEGTAGSEGPTTTAA